MAEDSLLVAGLSGDISWVMQDLWRGDGLKMGLLEWASGAVVPGH